MKSVINKKEEFEIIMKKINQVSQNKIKKSTSLTQNISSTKSQNSTAITRSRGTLNINERKLIQLNLEKASQILNRIKQKNNQLNIEQLILQISNAALNNKNEVQFKMIQKQLQSEKEASEKAQQQSLQLIIGQQAYIDQLKKKINSLKK